RGKQRSAHARAGSPPCFFFSSRRRHTRFSRDWSSDVCSSDLGRGQRSPHRLGAAAVQAGEQHQPLLRQIEGGQLRVALRVQCQPDRKSTRLNSSHVKISYAVFCLKKKKKKMNTKRGMPIHARA